MNNGSWANAGKDYRYLLILRDFDADCVFVFFFGNGIT